MGESELSEELLELLKKAAEAKQPERVIILKLPNGESIEAPVGIWFLAWTEIMDPDERTRLFNRVKAYEEEAMKKPIIHKPPGMPTGLVQGNVVKQDFTVDKNGKKHYTMHCEGGVYNSKFTPLKGAG